MLGSTAKEAFTHLITDVIKLDKVEIKQLAKAGIYLYSRLKTNTYDNINTLCQDKDILIDVFRGVLDWRFYMENNNPLYNAIRQVDKETWANDGIALLLLNHRLTATAIFNALPAITVVTVMATQIESTSFFKYMHVVLLDKSQFAIFYDNLLTQETRYNIFLPLTRDFNPTDNVIPNGISPGCMNIITTIL